MVVKHTRNLSPTIRAKCHQTRWTHLIRSTTLRDLPATRVGTAAGAIDDRVRPVKLCPPQQLSLLVAHRRRRHRRLRSFRQRFKPRPATDGMLQHHLGAQLPPAIRQKAINTRPLTIRESLPSHPDTLANRAPAQARHRETRGARLLCRTTDGSPEQHLRSRSHLPMISSRTKKSSSNTRFAQSKRDCRLSSPTQRRSGSFETPTSSPSSSKSTASSARTGPCARGLCGPQCHTIGS